MCLVLVKLFCFTCVLFSYILFMQIFPLVKPAFIFFSLCGRVALPVINELCCKCLLFSTNTEVYQRCIQRDRSVCIFPVCLLHIVVSNLFLSLCIGNNQHPVHRASHLFDFKNTQALCTCRCLYYTAYWPHTQSYKGPKGIQFYTRMSVSAYKI